MMYHVYVDYREDSGQPFYVGIGDVKRTLNFKPSARNVHHHNTWQVHSCVRISVPFSDDWKLTCEEERRLIRALKTRFSKDNPHGCNETDGGDGPMTGRKHSVEALAKIAIASKNRKHSQETREKMRIKALGRKHSLESKMKIGIASKGRVPPNKGKSISSEQRAKFVGYKHSVETISKIIIARKNQVCTAETKAKMSVSQKRIWAARLAQKVISQ